jgi:hypothetical protein
MSVGVMYVSAYTCCIYVLCVESQPMFSMSDVLGCQPADLFSCLLEFSFVVSPQDSKFFIRRMVSLGFSNKEKFR